MAEHYDHTKVRVIEVGSGTPLVMLHGWGRSASDLQGLGELLSGSYKVLLIDLPGFGASPPPPPFGSAEYAEVVMQLLRDRGINKFHLLGHSFGGRVSIHLAAHFPEQVSALTLIGSHGLKRRRSLGQKLRMFVIRHLGKLVKFIDRTFNLNLYRERFAKRFGSQDYQNAGVLRETLVKLVNEDQSQMATKIKCPTLLIWGELDTATPPEFGERFNRLIPNSKLILLPAKDHDPYMGTGAHLCASHIFKFLKEL